MTNTPVFTRDEAWRVLCGKYAPFMDAFKCDLEDGLLDAEYVKANRKQILNDFMSKIGQDMVITAITARPVGFRLKCTDGVMCVFGQKTNGKWDIKCREE